MTDSPLSGWVNGIRHVALASIVGLALTIPVGILADSTFDTVYSFDIPPQRADLALITFAKQSERTLVFSYDITNHSTSNSLLGSYSVLQGLDYLLKGTGLLVCIWKCTTKQAYLQPESPYL